MFPNLTISKTQWKLLSKNGCLDPTDLFLLLPDVRARDAMIFPSCSIDGCLKIFEPEIRYSLCPRAKRDALENDMKLLKESKELTSKTIKDPAINGGREANIRVAAWMENVDELRVEVDKLLGSLSTNGCCRLRSNYKNGRRVEEMLRRVTNLKEDCKKWDTDHDMLFRPNAPRVSAPTASEIRGGSSSVQAEPGRVEAPRVSAPTASDEIHEESSTAQEPWTLFCSYAKGGAADLTRKPSIEQEAREIVGILVECCGSANERLDLAMRVVAASLSKHSTARPWEDAALKLRSIAASVENNISDGTPIIERILRFCYDGLGTGRLKDCLSACASLDYRGPVSERGIVSYWMGQGLLDDGVSIDQAYDEGRRVIDRLRAAHWLQSSHLCDYFLIMDVHIQSMVREASRHMVIPTPTGEGRELQAWRDSEATGVTLRHPGSSLPDSDLAFKKERLPEGTPVCPLLVSLLLGGKESITRIHHDFFRFTPQLLVLDLSETNIQVLPRSIGELKLLRLLKLTRTKIKELPIEVGNMRELRQLEMKDIRELKDIRRECITRLSKLQALFMTDNGHKWNHLPGSEYLSLEDLRAMTRIQQLFLTARNKSDLTKMRGMFGPALTGLTMEGEDLADMRSVFSSLPRLEYLEVSGCPLLGELRIENGDLGRVREIVLVNLPITTIAPEAAGRVPGELEYSFLPTLRQLNLHSCHSLPNLTWVGRLSKLELVRLEKCKGISMLVGEGGPGDWNAGSEGPDDGGVTFPKLQFLVLSHLPRLSSFSWRHPLRLPSLRALRVKACPMLRKLPFGPRSCEDIKEIKGTWDWWNSLEWDHSDIQDKFGAFFEPYDA